MQHVEEENSLPCVGFSSKIGSCALGRLPSTLREASLSLWRRMVNSCRQPWQFKWMHIKSFECSPCLLNIKAQRSKVAQASSWQCFFAGAGLALECANLRLRYLNVFPLLACERKLSVLSPLRGTKKISSTLLCSCHLFLTGQIKWSCVSFIGSSALPLKASSQEMEEEVRGCAPSVIRYTVVAPGYYLLIDSE